MRPIYTAKFESKIKDFVETPSNPFESNESTFLSTDSRATERKEGKKRKVRFSHEQEHEDSISSRDNIGNTVRIIQDT